MFELARIQQKAALPSLFARLAAQTGQVLNLAAAGEASGLRKRTVGNYTKLLEEMFLVYRLPSWGRTLRARAGALPKLHIVDSGLAARLLRLSVSRLARPDAAALQQFGHLLETFVVGEVRKQVSWMDDIAGIGHWRTRDGSEVDLVVERGDGSVIGLEVKAGSRVARKDLSGLRILREALGDAFVAGAALYTGNRSYVADDRIYVLPIDRLWQHFGPLQDR